MCRRNFPLRCAAHCSLRSFPTRRSSDLPRVVLSEGEYRAIAKNEGKVFERPFNVVNGVDDVEGPFEHRSEEHTSELQQSNLVCRLLLEKKKKATPKAEPSAEPSPPHVPP